MINNNNNLAVPRKALVLFFIGAFSVLLVFNIGSLSSSGDANSSESWTRCKHVSVEELDQWFNSTKPTNRIPKIIHQSWKNRTLRPRQAKWSETWCNQYTDWRYRLWTDEENEQLVRTKFPWFYSTYETLSPPILRADSMRYLYMAYYGGIYVDLDYESIRRVDKVFDDAKVVLSLINYQFHSMNSAPNSWMASQPRHPVWSYISYRIMLLWSGTSKEEKAADRGGKAEYYTGPQALFEGLMFYLKFNRSSDATLNQLFGSQPQKADSILRVDDVMFLGPKFMNAYDWMTRVGADVCSAELRTFDEKKCQDIVKPMYAITYWSHTYGHGHQSDKNYLG